MLLRNPISTTKRFFQRTLQSFKSLLSGGGEASYQRLPKSTPTFNPFSCARSTQPQTNSCPHPDQKKMLPAPAAEEAHKERIKEGTEEKPVSTIKKRSSPVKAIWRQRGNVGEEETRDANICLNICLVAKRLKEMEMVDKGNVDHLLDIDEIFHYYSRLTCPAYVHIVDEFFMELYAEFLGNSMLIK